MVKKLSDFLKGEIISSVFYILFGLCLVAIPTQTINIICKVVFGLVMVGAGIYHIYNYAREKENTTILDLFTGVIVLVLGGFLFFTPQIIIKLLPYLLGAFVLVDSIWTLKGAWKLKKLGNTHWKVLVIGSLVFVGLGLFIIVYPFTKVLSTARFAGCVMLADGISDIVFLVLLRKGIKKGVVVKAEAPADAAAAVAEPVVDEGESEDTVQDEVIINGRWKKVAEEENAEEVQVSPADEIGAMKPEEQKKPNAETFVTEEPKEAALEEESAKEEPAKEDSLKAEPVTEETPKTEPQEEILEEWKD